VHGVALAVAWRGVPWMLLFPTAIACSDARALIPNSVKGMWFQWHRGINLVAIVSTVVGIAIAVLHHPSRTKKRLGGTCFSKRQPHHQKSGLAVVLISATVNCRVRRMSRPPAPSRTRRQTHPMADDDEEEAGRTKQTNHKQKATSAGMPPVPAVQILPGPFWRLNRDTVCWVEPSLFLAVVHHRRQWCGIAPPSLRRREKQPNQENSVTTTKRIKVVDSSIFFFMGVRRGTQLD
jgi:hypothetical protein